MTLRQSASVFNRIGSFASSRAPSARILALRMRLPKMTSRDLVLIADDYNGPLRAQAIPLGLDTRKRASRPYRFS